MSNFKYKQYILDTLKDYKKFFPKEEFPLLKKQLDNNENIWTRKNFNWHLTASAYILTNDFSKILLIHNINLDKWIAPGWHWEEGDWEMQNNSFREAKEETWLSDLEIFSWHKENNFIPIDVDTHYTSENKRKEEAEHFHHDFRYIFIYSWDLENTKIQEQEIKWLKWIDFDDKFLEDFKERVFYKIQNIKNAKF